MIRHLHGYAPLTGYRALECVERVSQKNSPGEARRNSEVPGGDADAPAPSGRDEGGTKEAYKRVRTRRNTAGAEG